MLPHAVSCMNKPDGFLCLGKTLQFQKKWQSMQEGKLYVSIPFFSPDLLDCLFIFNGVSCIVWAGFCRIFQCSFGSTGFMEENKEALTCLEFHCRVVIPGKLQSISWLLAKWVFLYTLLGWSQFWFVKILHNHLSPGHMKTSVRDPNLWVLGKLQLEGACWFPEMLLYLLEVQK